MSYYYMPSNDLKTFIQNVEDKIYSPAYTFVILGKTGPTGKTYLTNKLVHNGYRAVEITDGVFGLIDYKEYDNNNHYKIDKFRNVIIVILNKPLVKMPS